VVFWRWDVETNRILTINQREHTSVDYSQNATKAATTASNVAIFCRENRQQYIHKHYISPGNYADVSRHRLRARVIRRNNSIAKLN
jgi:hypothetical protein